MVENNRTAKRTPALIIAFLCLIVCCAVVSLVRPRTGIDELATKTIPVISLVRTIPAPRIKSVGFSPTSNHFFVTHKDNSFEVYSPSGGRKWAGKLPELASGVLSAKGDYLMAYSDRNPADSNLTFIDSSGATFWQMRVDGAVWCADSCSEDGTDRFVVGTGKGFVYVIDIGPKTRKYRRWRMPGAVVSLGVDATGKQVFAASWQKSAVRLASLAGQKKWETQAQADGIQRVRPLVASDRVMVEFEPLDARKDGTFEVLDGSGKKLFGGVTSVDEKTTVFASPSGRFVCCGVCKLITHKGKAMRERHAVLMDESGRVMWEKGSPFFQTEPLAVTRSGYAIISDGKKSIFLVSPGGEMRPSHKIAAAVRGCVASRDGSKLLLDCIDNTLVLLNVAQ